MTRRRIRLFMFPYQVSYRAQLEHLARDVLSELGAEVEAKMLLVGLRKPGKTDCHPVCVEPENGQWPLSLFDALLEQAEKIYEKHPQHQVFYGDDASNRDNPEWIRRSSSSAAVVRALQPYDIEHDVRSYCGNARLVGDYYVVPVIQLPMSLSRQFPQLDEKPRKNKYIGSGYRSLIDAALATVLAEATSELERPEPGRYTFPEVRRPEEIVRIAANRFLDTPGLSVSSSYVYSDLFTRLNLISSLLYEGSKGIGRLLLINPENPSVDYVLRFRDPVPFREPRWTRKVLQLVSPDILLIADSERVYGLGRWLPSSGSNAQDAFMVEFLDHYTWELSCAQLRLLRCEYGSPSLPRDALDRDALVSTLERLFPKSTHEDRDQIWTLFIAAAGQDLGSMIVVADDAEAEAQRLALQGTGIAPVKLTVDLLRKVSAIDGTIILDPHANCHAIGVILDGPANEQCTPSRGSRFNSAVRYVGSGPAHRLALIVSEDRTVDVFPALRPRLSRGQIERHLREFAASDVDNYHSSMNWLSKRRFYLDAVQCAEINLHLERLSRVPREVGELRYLVDPFAQDPGFDASYLTE